MNKDSVIMDQNELTDFLAAEFPQVQGEYSIDRVAPMEIDVRLNVQDRHLRPGGTISGPSMFSLADVSMYLAVLAMIGPEALTVTTSANLDFMRKPVSGRDLIAKCRILKLGRVLAVGEVHLYSEGSANCVARAAMTYSIPPK
ncbi:MAG: PaaI family thioesterase [Paracoccaceae bacterium]|nr:PaaI family thioesterase [Paracoccaceae bacterium]